MRQIIFILSIGICLQSVSQSRLQFHFGSGINLYRDNFGPVRFVNDSISTEFASGGGIPRTQVALYADFDAMKNGIIRAGLDYRKGYMNWRIYKSSDNPFPDETLLQFAFHEFNPVVDINYRLAKQVYVVAGGFGSFRFKQRDSGFYQILGTWSDEEIDDIVANKENFRHFAFGFRWGIGIKPIQRVGIELVRSRYLSDGLSEPFQIYRESINNKFDLSTLSVHLVYFFNLSNKED